MLYEPFKVTAILQKYCNNSSYRDISTHKYRISAIEILPSHTFRCHLQTTLHTTHLSEMMHFFHMWFLGFSCYNNLSSILQYTTRSKETRSKINFEFKKGVGIAIKSKETSS